jgi:GntR family transcriptional regulator
VPSNLFADPVALCHQPGTPAHVQIERWFTDAISRGDLTAGDRVPREQDLAAVFGVSRMTLRQALAALQSRGVVDRQPGRAGGTFIVEPKIICDLTGLAGFTEQLRRAHLRARARVLSARTIPAPRAVAAALAVGRGAAVHEIARIRSAERTPLALERSYFPAAVFVDLLDQPLTGSLYSLMARRYRLGPHTATEALEPVSVTAEQAAALHIAEGTAVMGIQRTAYTVGGLPVEYACDLFRPDRIRISVRSGWSNGRITARNGVGSP